MNIAWLNKRQLEDRGWTPEKLRERLKGCRENSKNSNMQSFTNRLLNINIYQNYKTALFTLMGNRGQ